MNIKIILRRHSLLLELVLVTVGAFVVGLGLLARDMEAGFYRDWVLNLVIDLGVAFVAAAIIHFALRYFGETAQLEHRWGLREIYDDWADDKPQKVLSQLFKESSTVRVIALSGCNTLTGGARFTERLSERLTLRRTTEFILASDEEIQRRAREDDDKELESKSKRSVANITDSIAVANGDIATHLRRCHATITANIYLFDGAAFIVPLLSGKARKHSPGFELSPGLLMEKYERTFADLWNTTQ